MKTQIMIMLGLVSANALFGQCQNKGNNRFGQMPGQNMGGFNQSGQMPFGLQQRRMGGMNQQKQMRYGQPTRRGPTINLR